MSHTYIDKAMLEAYIGAPNLGTGARRRSVAIRRARDIYAQCSNKLKDGTINAPLMPLIHSEAVFGIRGSFLHDAGIETVSVRDINGDGYLKKHFRVDAKFLDFLHKRTFIGSDGKRRKRKAEGVNGHVEAKKPETPAFKVKPKKERPAPLPAKFKPGTLWENRAVMPETVTVKTTFFQRLFAGWAGIDLPYEIEVPVKWEQLGSQEKRPSQG